MNDGCAEGCVTCIGCGSHTIPIGQAQRAGEPCPGCGLSAAASAEITSVRAEQGQTDLRSKRLPDVLSDGRPVARPGADGLSLYLAGVTIRGVLGAAGADDWSMAVWLDFSRSYGWWKPLGDPDAEAVRFTGQYPGVLALLPTGPDGAVRDTLGWQLMNWELFADELEVYAGLGMWSLLHSPANPFYRVAVISTLVPPDGEGNWLGPESAADRDGPPVAWTPVPDPLAGDAGPPRLAELTAAMLADGEEREQPARPMAADVAARYRARHGEAVVALNTVAPGGETVFSRAWAWPLWRAEKFAGMMTAQVGPPVEAFAPRDQVIHNAKEHTTWLGEIPPDR